MNSSRKSRHNWDSFMAVRVECLTFISDEAFNW